jgi:serine/threonine protein kinase
MIGEIVSHYKILEELGSGGMGAVYKAEDTRLKRTVALKFLSPDCSVNTEENPRFIREAQASAALREHPNRVAGAGRNPGSCSWGADDARHG